MTIREKYMDLLTTLRAEKDPEIFEFVTDAALKMSAYVESVFQMQIEMMSVHDRYEGDSIPERITWLDRNRRTHHDAAIDAVRQLNRMCRVYAAEPLYDGNENDRQEIAEFCMSFVKEVFDCRNIARR